jgi:hypothetical protein
MARPLQRIKIYGVQDRRNAERLRLPWVVRYTIDGAHRSKSYRTKAEAERYRGALLQAVQDGERFDLATGEPESWQLPLAELPVHEWTRRWLADQWYEWQPRSRFSASEALARFVTLAVRPEAVLPDALGPYVRSTLGPATEGDLDADLETWLDRNCLILADLDKRVVSDIARELARRLDGEPFAATTAARYRTNARGMHPRCGRGRCHPHRSLACPIEDPLTPQTEPVQARGGHPVAARPENHGARLGGDRLASAGQRDLSRDDSSRLLRRTATIGDRDAARSFTGPASRRVGTYRGDGGGHLL